MRMSTAGNWRMVSAVPSAVPLSAASFSSFAPGTRARMSAMAASTLAAVRPLTMTVAPSRARAVAISRPMPPVEAVTSAVMPSSSRSIPTTITCHYMPASRIDRDSPLPYYAQLKAILAADLEAERLLPGDRLPGEHELCETYGVSRTVVRQTLGELEAEGRLRRHKGRGTFVASPKVAEAMTQHFSGPGRGGRGARRHAAQRGAQARGHGPAPAAAAGELEIGEPGEPVIVLERLCGSWTASRGRWSRRGSPREGSARNCS